MSTRDDERAEFERRARELLDESTERLDARVRSRLTQARAAAIEVARGSRGGFSWRLWIPAGALAGAAALAVLLWSGTPQSPATPTLAIRGSLEDIDILVTDESFELLEELEFYQWVAVDDGHDASIG
jgi:hypothetical protein